MNGDLEKFRERVIETLRAQLEPHSLDQKYVDALMAIQFSDFGGFSKDEVAQRIYEKAVIGQMVAGPLWQSANGWLASAAKLSFDAVEIFDAQRKIRK